MVFGPGVSVFVGPNGQGKTNIVEALLYLATLGSHRVASNAVLVGDGLQQATIYAELRHDERSVAVGLTLPRKGSSAAVVNGAKARALDLPQWTSVVMFAPEDIGIVRGEPTVRRAFMDSLVISSSPSFAVVYQDFDRVLKQRNSLLKSLRASRGSRDTSSLTVWTEKLCVLGAEIMVARVKSLDTIVPMATQHYETLAGSDTLAGVYSARTDITHAEIALGDVTSLARVLANDVAHRSGEEIDRGMTLVGPQRDDVVFAISGKPARSHASQGETWSLALSLRLATAQWLREERSSGDPIIILDDVFAELDAQRRIRLVSLVEDYTQIIVTSAVEDDLPSGLSGTKFDVAAGVVTAR